MNAVNNISFKAIYYESDKSMFSDSQKRVADDIEQKLATKAKKNNYLIERSGKKVKLAQLFGVEINPKNNEEIGYVKSITVGKYDDSHPFILKDSDTVIPKYRKKLALTYFTAILTMLGAFAASALIMVNGNKNNSVAQTEKVVTIAKDSLQTLKQDSLKIAKDSLSRFK